MTVAPAAAAASVAVSLAAFAVALRFEVLPPSPFVPPPGEWFASVLERKVLLLLVGCLAVCVLLAAWVELGRRRPNPPGPAIVAALLAVAWSALPIALWSEQQWVRGIAFLVGAVLPVALVQFVLMRPAQPAAPIWWRPTRIGAPVLWAVPYLLVVVVAALYLLARDPFLDPRCVVHCARTSPVLGGTGFASFSDAALSSALAAAGLLAALAGIGTLRGARTGLQRLWGAAAAGCGLAELVWVLAPSSAPVVGPAPLAMPGALLVRMALHLCLALTTLALLVSHARRRSQLRRMVREVEAVTPPNGVRAIIASRLGDPDAQVLFHVPGEGLWIEEDGRPAEPGADRSEAPTVEQVAVVSREGEPLARIAFTGAEVRADDLHDVLGPATVLALEAERARAELLMRLRILGDARRRVVAASDQARRRAERDLHDGAQHLLLAATFSIQEALGAARASGDSATCARLEHALADLTSAAADLRDVAHGMYPVMLGDAGLVPALEGLALASPVRTTVDATYGGGADPSVELTVYQACALAVAAATGSAVSIELRDGDDRLRLNVAGAQVAPEAARDLADRATALGGKMECPSGRLLLEVPCGS